MLRKVYKSLWFFSAVIALITLIVFWRVLIADFVMWDDDRMVYLNHDLKGLSLEHIGWIFTHVDVTRRYTPLAALNYSITYQLCRLNPFGYHLSPWLFHGLNAAIFFFVLRILLIRGLSWHGRTNVEFWRITSSAAVGALVWSLHPLRTEAVAWVGASFYSQAMFFLLLSFLCYLWANEADISSQTHFRRVLASAGLFAAAILSHPIVIGFFFVFIVLDVYPLGKIRGIWWKSAEARTALLEKLPFIAVGLIIAAVTVIIRLNEVSVYGKPVPLAYFGLFERVMQAMYIWAYYIWRPWYPVNLAPIYTTLVFFDPLSPPFVVSAALVIGIITLLIRFRRRWPLGLALGVCYFALLVPVLGILEHPHYPCDRYSLIVSTSWSVLLAAWLASPETKPLFRNITLVLSIIVIAALGMLTFRQTRVWNNSISFFEHIVNTPGNDSYRYDIHLYMAKFLAEHGQTDKAIEHYRKSLELKDDSYEVHDNLGNVLLEKGRIDEAIEHYKKAIRLAEGCTLGWNLQPGFAEAHYNFAKALAKLGRSDQAVEEYKKVIKSKPDDVDAINDMGSELEKLGRSQEAAECYAKAIEIRPDNIIAHGKLALVLAGQGKIDEAIKEIRTVLTMSPSDVDMHRNLGILLERQGKISEAMKEYQEALGKN